MKPKDKKDAWLIKNFNEVEENNSNSCDRDVRKLRKLWKKQRNKYLRTQKIEYDC